LRGVPERLELPEPDFRPAEFCFAFWLF
jgi:hypothetical protein